MCTPAMALDNSGKPLNKPVQQESTAGDPQKLGSLGGINKPSPMGIFGMSLGRKPTTVDDMKFTNPWKWGL